MSKRYRSKKQKSGKTSTFILPDGSATSVATPSAVISRMKDADCKASQETQMFIDEAKSLGLKAEIKVVPYSSLDFRGLRLEEPQDETNMRVGWLTEHLADAPPPVLYDYNGRYDVADGNHRGIAYGVAGLKRIRALVITPDEDRTVLDRFEDFVQKFNVKRLRLSKREVSDELKKQIALYKEQIRQCGRIKDA